MNLHAGPELDELILNKVFGKAKAEIGYLQNYSTEMNAAFKIIERMDELDFFCVSSVRKRENKHRVCFEQYYPKTPGERFCADAADFCYSICLAALKAVGVEV